MGLSLTTKKAITGKREWKDEQKEVCNRKGKMEGGKIERIERYKIERKEGRRDGRRKEVEGLEKKRKDERMRRSQGIATQTSLE